MRYSIIIFVLLIMAFTTYSCRKEPIWQYEVNPQTEGAPTAGKDKLKTPEQYAAILHVNLYNKPMTADDLYDLSRIYLSIGDKEIAREVIIANFMNDNYAGSYAYLMGYPVIKPTDAEWANLRKNETELTKFITQTYERFFLRQPTQAELTFQREWIGTHPNLTPDKYYFSFAIANEYQFY